MAATTAKLQFLNPPYPPFSKVRGINLFPTFSVIALSLSLIACTHKLPPPSDINGFPPSAIEANAKISRIRVAALQETATSLGAQSGLAWTSKQINQKLEADTRNLDQIFNFRSLLLNNNVQPPVLVEGRKTLVIDDPDTLRLADKVYEIINPPRFVTAPANWRDYLTMHYEIPEKPTAAFLPRNAEEREVWNEFVLQGWKDGISQANGIFTANMGRLKRDYNGMITYRVLLAQRMVTPPFVASTNLGVTGDENKIRINDQILRITSTSRLIPNSKHWRAVIVPGTEGAIRKQGIEGTENLE